MSEKPLEGNIGLPACWEEDGLGEFWGWRAETAIWRAMAGLSPITLSEDYEEAVAQHANGRETEASSAHRIRQIRQSVGIA
jgi:hypothetical protein